MGNYVGCHGFFYRVFSSYLLFLLSVCHFAFHECVFMLMSWKQRKGDNLFKSHYVYVKEVCNLPLLKLVSKLIFSSCGWGW